MRAILTCALWLGYSTLGCKGDPEHGSLHAGTCRDPDGDGFGLYCADGADCDETDSSIHEGCSWCGGVPEVGCPCDEGDTAECAGAEPIVDATGQEVCQVGTRSCIDGAWGECVYESTRPVSGDGSAAGGILGDAEACGPCELDCQHAEDVPQQDDLGDDNSKGVVFDPLENGLVIGGGGGDGFPPYAWIANEGNGTISKLDQATGTEVARYYTDAPPIGPISPSRTAIDSVGNAYVGNRAITGGPSLWFGPSTRFSSVSKFAGDTRYCRNGARTTTHDSNPLPYGTDDCLIWTVTIGTKVGAMVRAVAISKGDDAHPDGYPWVGTTIDTDGLGLGRAYKLNPDTGTVICSVALPISVYGATSDGQNPEKVWFSENQAGGRLVAVDTTCHVVGTYTNQDPWCGDNANAYAITTDGQGRIWQAGSDCGDARRFDPATNQWCYVDTRGFGPSKGITVDNGRTDGITNQAPQVWLAHYANPSHLSSWNVDEPCVATDICTDTCTAYRGASCIAWSHSCVNRRIITPAKTRSVFLPAGFHGAWGVGVDFTAHSRVWVVPRGSNDVSVYDPLSRTTTKYPSTPAALQAPYTYSDFTGFQFRAFVSHEGSYWRDYGDPAVCGFGQVGVWRALQWSADTPAGTHIRFEAQGATTAEGLGAARVIVLGETPPETSGPGIDVGAALLAAGVPDGIEFLRLRTVLVSDDRVTSPVLHSVDLSWVCEDAE